jgi:hypothetical protein
MAIATKLLCQPAWLAKNKPLGTPTTVAKEKDIITKPVARPRRSNGMTSPMMVCDNADKMPPNTPADTRADINQAYDGAKAHASVVKANKR